MPTLPTMINQDRTELALQPAVDRIWAAALTLILLILVLNLAGRVVSRFGTGPRMQALELAYEKTISYGQAHRRQATSTSTTASSRPSRTSP